MSNIIQNFSQPESILSNSRYPALDKTVSEEEISVVLLLKKAKDELTE